MLTVVEKRALFGEIFPISEKDIWLPGWLSARMVHIHELPPLRGRSEAPPIWKGPKKFYRP